MTPTKSILLSFAASASLLATVAVAGGGVEGNARR
jgi:hypothetical protein